MDWFKNLTKDERKLLSYKQKQELANFDRKVERENRNWNRLSIPVGLDVKSKGKQSNGFNLNFVLSQNYRFLQPIEREVVKLLVQKYKLSEIADMLGLSYSKTRGLVTKIRKKMVNNA